MPPLRNNARGNTGIARNIEAVYNPAAAEHYGLENTTDRTEIAIRKKIYCDYNKSYQAQHNGVFPSHRQCVAEIVRQQNHAAIPLNDIQVCSKLLIYDARVRLTQCIGRMQVLNARNGSTSTTTVVAQTS